MYALVNILNGVPAVPGVPVLNPANLRPVYPARPEAEALEHWLLGGSADSLIGLKGVSTLAPANAAPAYEDGYIVTATGGLNGLVSSIDELGVYTIAAVVRYDAVSADRRMVFDTAQGGTGDGRGIALYNQDNWGYFALARPNASATAMPQGYLTAARDGWIFIGLSVDVAGNKWRCFVGGVPTPVEVTPASSYLPSTRKLALGNAYYVSGSPSYQDALAAAELIVIEGYPSTAELQSLYERSKERMAQRGITVY